MQRVRLLKAEEQIERLGTSAILDQKLIRQFTSLVERGLPLDGVCDYLGLPGITFFNWLRKGDAYLTGNGELKEYRMYGEFVRLLRKATAKYRLILVDRLHGDEDWIRCMTILERRDRRNFSRKEPSGGGEESLNPDERFL